MDLYPRFASKENLKTAFWYLKAEMDENPLSIDPIWKPSMNAVAQLGDQFFEALQECLRKGRYQPDRADYMYAQKDNLGVRPICVFSVVDRIVFQALLNPLVLGNVVDKKLFRFCLGHRLLGKKAFLKPYKNQWIKFCDKQIETFKQKYDWRIEFDIQAYYENIHIDSLITILKEKFSIPETKLSDILDILEKQLKTWAENSHIALGLPQGPNASNVLANAYLQPLDAFIFEDLADGNFKDFRYFRYVDDIVIMAKSADKINQIVEKIVLFLRKYNLKLNEKTKLERLKDTKSLEEVKFYNPYGKINETSKQKVEKIGKQLPEIFRKIKSGDELKKTEMSGLKYYLKAGANLSNPEFIEELMALIPLKPSLIPLICRYLGFYISDPALYQKIWKIYCNSTLTEWTKFWLLKLLAASPTAAKKHAGFQRELNRIIDDKKAKFLRITPLFYKAYSKEINPNCDLGFTLDDIRRFIKDSETEVEKAIYYYFLIYLKDVEDKEAITALMSEALQSSSPEIQLMGIFIARKMGINPKPGIIGDLGSLYRRIAWSRA